MTPKEWHILTDGMLYCGVCHEYSEHGTYITLSGLTVCAGCIDAAGAALHARINKDMTDHEAQRKVQTC